MQQEYKEKEVVVVVNMMGTQQKKGVMDYFYNMYMGSYKARVFISVEEYVLPGRMVDMDVQMVKEYKERSVVA